jgi:WD40 repeat protein
VVDLIGEKILPCPEGVLCSASRPHEQVHWDGDDLRVLVDNKVHRLEFDPSPGNDLIFLLQVVHVTEAASCTCATWADPQNLVTGSSDHIVRVWQYTQSSQSSSFLSRGAGSLHIRHIMRVHTDAVICVAASRAWSMVVSGSKDDSAAVWDLNRGVYVRSIWHNEEGGGEGVHIVAINDSTVSDCVSFPNEAYVDLGDGSGHLGIHCHLLEDAFASSHHQCEAYSDARSRVVSLSSSPAPYHLAGFSRA